MRCHHEPHRPAFFISVHRKSLNARNTTTNCLAISISNKNFVQNTMAQASHTQSVNIGDGSSNCGNITSSFNTTFYRCDEDAQIMRWLSPLEPNNRHHGVRNDRLAGVGDWVLETGEFQEWRGGEGGVDKAVLFCSGGPGVGKTYMR